MASGESMAFMHNLYNLLPDFSGIFLAAVGVALFFAPAWVEKINRTGRWLVAVLLILFEALGMRSSFVQRRNADKLQTELMERLKLMNAALDSVGPKLDNLMSNPHSSNGQRDAAAALKSQIQQHLKNSECAGIVAGGNVTNHCN